MPIYTYKAKIKPDTFRSGTIEAESEKAAINKLLLLNYHPVSIRAKSEENIRKFSLGKKITSKDIYIFLRQLANLNIAGLPIVKSLANISFQSHNPRLRQIVLDMKEKLQKGNTFSEALSFYPNVFSTFEINMIKSAETTGKLPEAVEKIADLKERDIDFNNRIRSALAYPILLLSVGAITLLVLTTFVLPKFITLFEDLDQQLPILTQMLINTSLFLKNYWLVLGTITGLTVFFVQNKLRTKKGRFLFDRLMLKFPLVKDIVLKIQISRFARTLGNLIENGVPIINSLMITSEIATNIVFAQEIKHVHTQVTKGQHISAALKDSNVFDKNTLDLIAVGEESGRLDEMLFRIAQMNERESSGLIESLMFLIEPALILTLGIIVAIIVMAILLPIFQMNFLVQ